METKQIIGVILLILGIIGLLYGIDVKDSFHFSTTFGSGNDEAAIMIAGGVIIGAIGLVMVITGNSNKYK